MLIRPMSDLHIDVGAYAYKWKIPVLETDKDSVLVLAGDTCEMADGYFKWDIWLRHNCSRFKAVIAVAGNHEHYSGEYGKALNHFREVAKSIPNFHVLENEMVTIDNVHFLGCTLWTNYRNSNPIELIKMQTFSDHLCIEGFPPSKAVELNKQSCEFLRETAEALALLKKAGDKIVVVTHQAPSHMSEDPKYADSPIASAFSSDLDELVYDVDADLWIHGHIHWFSDYMLFGTRIICNALGYNSFSSGKEETGFKEDLVVTV